MAGVVTASDICRARAAFRDNRFPSTTVPLRAEPEEAPPPIPFQLSCGSAVVSDSGSSRGYHAALQPYIWILPAMFMTRYGGGLIAFEQPPLPRSPPQRRPGYHTAANQPIRKIGLTAWAITAHKS